MLISDSKQFIFIHLEKTAGTSITSALLPFSLQPNRNKWGSFLRLFNLPTDYHRYKFRMHCSLADVERKLPANVFEGYYKFSFVRNPWGRLVSEYNAALKKNRNRRHGKISGMQDFEEFVRSEIKRNKFLQLDHLKRQDGSVGADFVGRYENLANDFAVISEKLDLNISLPALNQFPHKPYRDYFSDTARELVADHWAEEIEYFGYQF